MNATEIATIAYTLLRRWPGNVTLWQLMQEHNDLQVYVAGGFLRNIALGQRLSKDIDLFLGGPSVEQFLNRLSRRGHVTPNAYGKWNWRPSAKCTQYFDLLPIRDFRVAPRRFFAITELLTHFDFSCNSIALDLRTGRITDPCGGIESCRRRELKMNRYDNPEYRPVDPANPLTEGAARWFRGLHYAAQLNLQIEPRTRRWLIANQHYLSMKEIFASVQYEPDLSRLADVAKDASAKGSGRKAKCIRS